MASGASTEWMDALMAAFGGSSLDKDHPFPAVLVPAGAAGVDGAVVAVFRDQASTYHILVLQHFGDRGSALSQEYGIAGRTFDTMNALVAELRALRGRFTSVVPEAEPLHKRTRAPSRMLVAYSDGASRGNPGPASYGFVVYVGTDSSGGGETLVERCRGAARIGMASNNVAEYHGAIEAVRAARRLANETGIRDFVLRTDSQLLVRQAMGTYAVRAPHLMTLRSVLLREASALTTVRFVHVAREHNTIADTLANEALNKA